METVNDRVCMTVAELDGIISYEAVKKLCQRGQVVRAQRGCRDRSTLYEVDSLPYKYRCEVYRRYPDLNAQAKAKPFIERVEPDGNAINYFEGYTFGDGAHLTRDKVELYSNDAAILNSFGSWLDNSNAMRKRTSAPKCPLGEFWANAAKALPRLADNYPNTLPENPRRLQDKYNRYRKDGYRALISAKHGNGNAAKVATDEQRSTVITLCALPNGFDHEFVARCYNEMAEKYGWPSITAQTVGRIHKESAPITDVLRHGGSHYSNTRAMQIARSKPTGAMLMWSLDGWDCELYYQKRNSKNVVTYSNRKVLEVVIDPCCDYPVGYAIGEVENAELITEALRDASNHTRALLGGRYRTGQVQSDHYAMKAMTPYYAAIAGKVTPARVKNAKSKPIERYFSYINDKYFKTQANWSGHGITASKENQPSTENLNLTKKSFPDEEGVIKQIKGIMEAERAAKREEYLRFWAATKEENRIPLSEETFLMRFGQTTGYTNVLEGSGLRPRIEGRRRQYDCFDQHFRDLAYIRWEVRYDSADLSRALAVSEDGRHRYMLEEKYVQPMALADRKEGDAEQLQRVLDFNQSRVQHISGLLGSVLANAKPLLLGEKTEQLESPDARNPLAKALLTDSRGQHKSERAEERQKVLEVSEITMPEKKEKVKEERKKKPALVPVPVDDAPAGEERVNTFDLY